MKVTLTIEDDDKKVSTVSFFLLFTICVVFCMVLIAVPSCRFDVELPTSGLSPLNESIKPSILPPYAVPSHGESDALLDNQGSFAFFAATFGDPLCHPMISIYLHHHPTSHRNRRGKKSHQIGTLSTASSQDSKAKLYQRLHHFPPSFL